MIYGIFQSRKIMYGQEVFRAIGKYCLEDMVEQRKEVEKCEKCDAGLKFDFLKWKMGKGKEKEVCMALRQIRICCYECCAGKWNDVINCKEKDCPLYPFKPQRRYKLQKDDFRAP